MLSHEENELLTQTDRGTPMGEVFRRFWIPAFLSEEIPVRNSIPVRFRLLGEDLVGFRDSEGRVGVIDAYCPHRGAPLEYGRNEESGLRCIYHGWKFDLEGNCLELPNVENGERLALHVKTIAYPAVERAGMVWIYMGPPERQPPLPEFPYFDATPENVVVTKYEIQCNWLQALEGDGDPSHVQFLHSTLGDNYDPVRAINGGGVRKPDVKPPRIPLLAETPIGLVRVYSAAQDDGSMSLSVGQMILPCFSASGIATPGVFSSNIRIPIDDTHIWHFRLRWTRRGFTPEELTEYKQGGFVFGEHELGSWRPKANKDNRYLRDTILQRHFNFSGVTTFPNQDVMMIEDQRGPIMDRSKEHLVATDGFIVVWRERLLKLARAFADGQEPEEPFLMKSIEQDFPGRLTVPASDTLDDDTVETIFRELKTAAV
jgi:phthalate 4,5-dioxygenase